MFRIDWGGNWHGAIGSANIPDPRRRGIETGTSQQGKQTMHYPHKKSKVKRARKIGFRARMRTKKGRQAISRKRRVGRRVQVV